jgi:hypothetical protein
MVVVFDSLSKSGMDTAMVARLRRLIEAGDPSELFNMFAGGGAGGGQAGRFNSRPGETGMPSAAAGGTSPATAAPATPDFGMLQRLQEAMKIPGYPNIEFNPFGFGGGGPARPQAPIVAPGDYLVTVTVNGRVMKQTLRVERASGSGVISSFFEQ